MPGIWDSGPVRVVDTIQHVHTELWTQKDGLPIQIIAKGPEIENIMSSRYDQEGLMKGV